MCFKRESHVDKFKARLSHRLRALTVRILRVVLHTGRLQCVKRLQVKQKLLEYLEDDADIEKKGTAPSTREEWNKKLDSEDALVLDIRNDYE